MKKLTIFINDQAVFEFNKEQVLEAQQLTFLEQMDLDMGKGIKILGELIIKPDSQQRSTFVSMNMIKAIQQENEAAIFASCAYLTNRYSELTEVHANDYKNTVKIKFVEE